MNILLIHNDNLKREFIKLFAYKETLFPSRSEMLSEAFDMDDYIDRRLKKIFDGKAFDAVFLPYTLNNENYLEYTGLSVAHHIRLSPYLNHQRVPIVFIGDDKPENIARLSNRSDILFAAGTFLVKEQTNTAKEKFEDEIISKGFQLNDSQFRSFLEKINILPPANYKSYHTLANEWGILRMSELLQNVNKNEQLVSKLNDVKNRLGSILYYKLLEARLASKRQKITNGDKIPPVIPSIEGKKIVYIDDEYAKGWNNVLKHIFDASKAKFYYYDKFEKSIPKTQLLDELKVYLSTDEIIEADVYIIDLRLCDKDFDDILPEQLSGNILADWLYTQNQGNQVVIFTASNKVWNLKQAIDKHHASGYVIKESPDLNYRKKDSLALYNDFVKSVKKASDNSFLKSTFELITQIKMSAYVQTVTQDSFFIRLNSNDGWLDQIFSLLRTNTELSRKQILLLFNSILESYSNIFFSSDNSIGRVKLKNGSEKQVYQIISSTDRKGLFYYTHDRFSFQKPESSTTVTDVSFHSTLTSVNNTDFTDKRGNPQELTKIISILKYRHSGIHFDFSKILTMRYLRSNSVAHSTGNIAVGNRPVVLNDVLFMLEILHSIFVEVT